MASLNITQGAALATDAQGRSVPALDLNQLTADPANVDFTSGEAKSAVFDKRTRCIRIVSDTTCYIKVGIDPTAAAADSTRVIANQPEVFAVQPKGTTDQRLSVISL